MAAARILALLGMIPKTGYRLSGKIMQMPT